MRICGITALALGASLAIAAAADAQAVPDRPLGHGALAFDADATLGKFTGTTTTLTGQLTGAATLAGVHGWVEAPAKSLTTNNGHRDRDMAGSMEFDKFPVIRFDLDSVSAGARSADSVAATLNGSFTIHGQKRVAKVPGWIWLTDRSARFRGALPIDVKNYGVGGLTKGPFGILKMNQMITVRIDVTFGEK